MSRVDDHEGPPGARNEKSASCSVLNICVAGVAPVDAVDAEVVMDVVVAADVVAADAVAADVVDIDIIAAYFKSDLV